MDRSCLADVQTLPDKRILPRRELSRRPGRIMTPPPSKCNLQLAGMSRGDTHLLNYIQQGIKDECLGLIFSFL